MQAAALQIMSITPQVERHDHDFHQMVLGIKRSSILDIAGYGGTIDENHDSIVPAKLTHAFVGSEDNLSVIIDVPDIELWNKTSLYKAPHHFDIDDSLKALLNYISLEVERFGENPLLAQSILNVVSLSIGMRLRPGDKNSSNEIMLGKLEEFLHLHLRNPIKVSQLAKHFNRSESNFYAAFKQKFSTSPIQFINKFKLNQAKHLMLNTNWPLAEIAEETGFSSQSKMTTLFKKQFNETPAHFRKNRKKPKS